jgi:hypothetical protein
MPQPRELIEPPAYVPGRSSLLAVAQVVEQVSGHWMFGTQWTETTCGSGVVAASGNFQNSAVTDPGAFTHDKLRFPYRTQEAFFLFATDDEPPVGLTADELRSRLSQKFLAGESVALEKEVWTRAIRASGAQDIAGASSLGTFTTITRAVAEVEEGIAVGYGGIGMIHVSPFTATCMAGANLFDTNGSKLATKVGTPVVVGTGYPAPTGGNMVVAGTGPVTIIRSGVRYVPDSLHDSLSPTVNQMTASAQRDYVVGWPCTTVKALATIPT